MNPTEQLSAEHRVIERVLAVLDKACDQLSRGHKVDPAIFTGSLDFIRNFADRCHHIKEEDNLFKRMGERGFPTKDGPIAVMLAEHEEGRRFVRGFAEAAERYANGDQNAGRDICQNARGYSELLKQHIMKEDNILYPMSKNVLTSADEQDLVERFDRLENEVIGVGAHERYHQLVDQLEAAVGTSRQAS